MIDSNVEPTVSRTGRILPPNEWSLWWRVRRPRQPTLRFRSREAAVFFLGGDADHEEPAGADRDRRGPQRAPQATPPGPKRSDATTTSDEGLSGEERTDRTGAEH